MRIINSYSIKKLYATYLKIDYLQKAIFLISRERKA